MNTELFYYAFSTVFDVAMTTEGPATRTSEFLKALTSNYLVSLLVH